MGPYFGSQALGKAGGSVVRGSSAEPAMQTVVIVLQSSEGGCAVPTPFRVVVIEARPSCLERLGHTFASVPWATSSRADGVCQSVNPLRAMAEEE
jgi:hypothetical protein